MMGTQRRLARVALVCLLGFTSFAFGQSRSDDAAAWLARGRQALAAQDLARAERDFQRVLQRDPRQEGAFTGLGIVAMNRGQWPQALDWLNRAIEKNPADATAWLDRGLVYCNLHEFGEGLKNFRGLLRLQPGSRPGRYLAGVTALYTGKSAASLRYLLPLRGNPPNRLEYYYDLSTAAQMENRNALSEGVLEEFKRFGDGSPAFHLLLGRAYLNHNQPEKALPELQQVAAVAPGVPLLHFTLGIAYQDLHRYRQAEEEFRQDLDVDPANAPEKALDWQRLGEIASQQHQDEASRADELHAIALAPGMAIAHLELGTVDLRLGRYAEAEQALRKAIVLYPSGGRAHYVLGRVLLRLKKQSEAKQEFTLATRLQQRQQGHLREQFTGGILTPVEGNEAVGGAAERAARKPPESH